MEISLHIVKQLTGKINSMIVIFHCWSSTSVFPSRKNTYCEVNDINVILTKNIDLDQW